MPRNITKTYEDSPWSSSSVVSEARNLTIQVTRRHAEESRWTRFRDAVSLAVKEKLGENACANVFWNSDGFLPRPAGDDARLGFYVEVTDPETGATAEEEYWLPLPRRAERGLKRLATQGTAGFQPFSFRVAIPTDALPLEAAPLRRTPPGKRQGNPSSPASREYAARRV